MMLCLYTNHQQNLSYCYVTGQVLVYMNDAYSNYALRNTKQ